MSFDNLHLESGHSMDGASSRKGAASSNPHNEGFDAFKDSMNLQIFKINSNVQGINRLIDKIGTAQDGAGLRKSLANLTESTRRMIERSGKDIQGWAAEVPETTLSKDRATQAKVAKEFAAAISSFQRSQKISSEKLKYQVAREQQKLTGDIDGDAQISDEQGNLNSQEHGDQVQQFQQSRFKSTNAGAIAFQESIIAERESEIQEIETGIHELNDIFHDLNKLVGEQGDMIDNIESNVTSVEADTRLAGGELIVAQEYQRKAGRRMICLMLLLVVVITIVLLAVLS